MDDGGVKLMRVGKVEVKAAAMFELFGAQGALVEAGRAMEEDVELKVTMTGSSKCAVGTVERWQDRRHSLVGER